MLAPPMRMVQNRLRACTRARRCSTETPTRFRSVWLLAPVLRWCRQARGGTILQSKLANGYTLGNLSAAHPNGRFRL